MYLYFHVEILTYSRGKKKDAKNKFFKRLNFMRDRFFTYFSLFMNFSQAIVIFDQVIV